ncbi:fmt, partial [Symbiodinium sp. CCMP2456]
IGLGASHRRLQRGRGQRCTRFAEGSPGRIVFLGSPDCVEVVLQSLWNASQASADFEVCAVVSRPPKRVKKVIAKTPVHELAEDLGVHPVSNILTPPSARDEAFLEKLEDLKPDVCVTAAYGEYLPRRFLEAPRLGTINLHPSLLPRWRGASPVQRCLVAGDTETGITILYTVAKMDAGPIIVQEKMALDGSETSPELLDKLFRWGGDLLVEVLPKILAGEVTMETAAVQDERLVEKAPLISKDEGKLWPHNETALQMRDKVRGFTGWPGTTLAIACSGSKAPPQGVRVKVAGAEVVPFSAFATSASPDAPLQELLFMPAVDGSEPVVGVRPAMDPENARTQVVRRPNITIKQAKSDSSQFQVLLLKSFQLPGKKEALHKFHLDHHGFTASSTGSSQNLQKGVHDLPAGEMAVARILVQDLSLLRIYVPIPGEISRFGALPQHLASGAMMFKYFRTSGVEPCGHLAAAEEISPGSLYLGGANAALGLAKANDLGITHVLNVSDLYVLAPGRHGKLLAEWVPMADDGFDDIFGPVQTAEEFEAARKENPDCRPSGAYWRCKDFLEAAFKDPSSRVLVHCALGVNRSASVVMAWLMETRGWSLTQALQHVQNRRPIVHPADKLKEQLLAYQEQLGIEEASSASSWASSCIVS